jgi:hypothetical protein
LEGCPEGAEWFEDGERNDFPMTYKICRVSEPPNYESLPIAKVTKYPLEPRDYRPFAQHILCVSEDFLHLRMWAFEVNPSPQSRLESVLYLFAKAPDTALAVVSVPGNSGVDIVGCCLLKNGRELPVSPALGRKLQTITATPYSGEDLQGVYWGCTIDIPLILLEQWSGKTLLKPGDSFPGNLYKICLDEKSSHLGCWREADFSANPYLLPDMGTFEVVSY